MTSSRYRSGLERLVASQLNRAGVPFQYEERKIKFVWPEKPATYTPDFELPNGIIIEAKGRFVTKDRQKHLLVRDQFPELDIRFVFSNPNQKIGKGSKTTYAMWCEKNGFLYSQETIPTSWINE